MNEKSTGSYILVLELEKNIELPVGKFGSISFQKGNYVYVGSALNGLDGRIKRHLRNQKKIHWHIDYLLKEAEIIDVFYKEDEKKYECIIAKSFDENFDKIIGFGCSDCKCESHLFFGSSTDIKSTVSNLNMKQYPFEAKS